MKQTFTNYYADSTCPYTLDGVHLTSLRRAVLAIYAEPLGIDPTLPKNEMIGQMMAKLRAMDADTELKDVLKAKPEPKKEKKAKE